MTENPFIYMKCEDGFYDIINTRNCHAYPIGNMEILVIGIVELLNELFKENEQLKEEKEYCEEELLKLRRDNEQLKTTCDNLIMKNQQLKMEIMRLEMIIKTGEKKDEHIGWKRVDVE